MNVSRSLPTIASGVALFGVTAQLLLNIVLFTVPNRLLSDAAATTFIETVFQPVALVGGLLVFLGTPLLAVCGAFGLVNRQDDRPRAVLAWFVVAGIGFGLGIAVLSWLFTTPSLRGSLASYAEQAARMTALVVLSAVVGALAGSRIESGAGPSLPVVG